MDDETAPNAERGVHTASVRETNAGGIFQRPLTADGEVG